MGGATSPLNNGGRLLAGLRDFFMAANEDQLRRAYETSVDALAPGAVPAPGADDVDWEDALYEFNRLFVGPMALQAPPFSSVWLSREPCLMGKSALDARHVYQMLGLESPCPGALPDDHVSLELDALAVMEAALAQGENEDLRLLRRYFLERHVLAWAPRFCARVLEIENAPPAVAAMAGALAAWLEEARRDLSLGQESGRPAARSFTTSDTLEVRS